MKFVVFREINQRWYWELRTADGGAFAKCPLGYSTMEQCFTAIQQLRQHAPKSLAFDLLGNLHEGV
jgi:uncharacterized protein YegP (UPF0339 family)